MMNLMVSVSLILKMDKLRIKPIILMTNQMGNLFGITKMVK